MLDCDCVTQLPYCPLRWAHAVHRGSKSHGLDGFVLLPRKQSVGRSMIIGFGVHVPLAGTGFDFHRGGSVGKINRRQGKVRLFCGYVRL